MILWNNEHAMRCKSEWRNGWEPSCPAEEGRTPLILAHPGGQGAAPCSARTAAPPNARIKPRREAAPA
jgi:hypothetical protein